MQSAHSQYLCVCVFPKGKNGRKERDRGSMWESDLCSRFIPESKLPSEQQDLLCSPTVLLR